MKFIKTLVFKLLKIASIIFLLLVIAAGVLVYFMYDDLPLVNSPTKLSNNDVSTVKQLISSTRANLKVFDRPITIVLSQENANDILRYLVLRVRPELRTVVLFEKNQVYLGLSLETEKLGLLSLPGKYINASIELKPDSINTLRATKLRLGNIELPKAFLTVSWPYFIEQFNRVTANYSDLLRSIKKITIEHKELTIEYLLRKQIVRSVAGQLRKDTVRFVLSEEMKARVDAYGKELKHVTSELHEIYGRKQFSLLAMLQPMAALAQRRSLLHGNSVEENRIMLVALGAYMAGHNIAILLDENAKPLPELRATLQRRIDLSRHYLISASLNAVGNKEWAYAIGIEKEMQDMNGRSGFSFSDLMADKAGVLLAENLLGTEQSATETTEIILNAIDDDAILPSVNGLPDNLTTAEYNRRYQGSNSYKYQSMLREIDRRLGLTTLYR